MTPTSPLEEPPSGEPGLPPKILSVQLVPEQFGAPRRFGIGTILVVMGAASVLLAFLVAWGAPAPFVFTLVAFLTLIGFGQAFLYQGTNPRRASIVSGAIICPIFALVLAGYILWSQEMGRRGRYMPGFEMCCMIVGSAIVGPFLGYLGGGVVGGIFLLMDRWEQRFGREKIFEQFDPFAPGETHPREPGTEVPAHDSSSPPHQ